MHTKTLTSMLPSIARFPAWAPTPNSTSKLAEFTAQAEHKLTTLERGLPRQKQSKSQHYFFVSNCANP
jgi:hypothetical protein